MPDPTITDVVERVGIPAATALGICWGAVKWALPRLLNDQIAAATRPSMDALERRLGEQQRALVSDLSKHTGQIARAIEKMSERMNDQATDIADIRGELRGVRQAGAILYDRRGEPR